MDTYLLPLAAAFCAGVTVYLLALRVRLPFGSRWARPWPPMWARRRHPARQPQTPRRPGTGHLRRPGVATRPGTLVLVRLAAGLLPALLLLFLGSPGACSRIRGR